MVVFCSEFGWRFRLGQLRALAPAVSEWFDDFYVRNVGQIAVLGETRMRSLTWW